MENFENILKGKLVKLPYKAKLLFGVIICEKLQPNYEAFAKRTNWGNNKVIIDGIALVYLYLINNTSVSISEIQSTIANIDLITPDTEDFEDITTSFALDSCTSLSSTLEFIINKDLQFVIDTSSFAIDTVYAFINLKENFDPLDASSEIQIEHDDFMVREKQRQMNLIEKLSKTNLEMITDDLISSLRDSQSIIDLSLLK